MAEKFLYPSRVDPLGDLAVAEEPTWLDCCAPHLRRRPSTLAVATVEVFLSLQQVPSFDWASEPAHLPAPRSPIVSEGASGYPDISEGDKTTEWAFQSVVPPPRARVPIDGNFEVFYTISEGDKTIEWWFEPVLPAPKSRLAIDGSVEVFPDIVEAVPDFVQIIAPALLKKPTVPPLPTRITGFADIKAPAGWDAFVSPVLAPKPRLSLVQAREPLADLAEAPTPFDWFVQLQTLEPPKKPVGWPSLALDLEPIAPAYDPSDLAWYAPASSVPKPARPVAEQREETPLDIVGPADLTWSPTLPEILRRIPPAILEGFVLLEEPPPVVVPEYIESILVASFPPRVPEIPPSFFGPDIHGSLRSVRAVRVDVRETVEITVYAIETWSVAVGVTETLSRTVHVDES